MNATRDVVISCMALRGVPDWLPWPGGVPSFIEFAGQMPAAGGHPTWGAVAQRYRDPSGQLLPGLFRAYRAWLGFELADVGRIAVVGFSAGSNSGVRELLRNPVDRGRISFVAAIDGEHPNLAATPPTDAQRATDPLSRYADFAGELGGLVDVATQAALDAGPAVVVTASSVAAPSPVNSDTRSALFDLQWAVESGVQQAGRRVVPPTLDGAFPPNATSSYLHAGERYPQPFTVSGCRRFVALYYPGTVERDHVLQARIVAPDVLQAFCVPFWSRSAAAPVGAERPAPTELVEAVAAPKLSPPVGWLPAALSAAALIGASFA